MKSQSFKLFAMALVLGFVSIFAAGSARAQTNLSFETSFDFHIGKEKLSAGKYQLHKIEHGKYLLRRADSKKSRLVLFDFTERNDASAADLRVTFNRYGETYFLRSVFEKPGADGRQIGESTLERQIRKGTATRENQLAGDKGKSEKVSVNLKN